MKRSARAAMAAGVSTLVVSAAAIAPVQPAEAPAPAPTVRLSAAFQPLEPGQEPPPIPALLRASGLLPSVVPTALPPGVPELFAFPIAPQLADDIDRLYLAVEPWVQYGFEVATYALAWVPYVGSFAWLIMDAYYFGEEIVASAVFNFTDFLRGDGGIVENLVDFGVDVGLAFVWLGIDALGTFVPLPPCNCYPPRPPLQGPFLALDSFTALGAPEQNAELMEFTSFDESSPEAETGLDETNGEQVETPGEELNLEQGAPGDEGVGELKDEGTGELVGGADGEEELIQEGQEGDDTPEEVVDLEETEVDGELNQEPTQPQEPSSPAPSTDDDDAQKTANNGDPAK